MTLSVRNANITVTAHDIPHEWFETGTGFVDGRFSQRIGILLSELEKDYGAGIYDSIERTGIVESASMEVGCLSYQRFISPDGESVHVYEGYLNSGAALAHLTVFFQRLSAQYATLVDLKIFSLRRPSSELRRMLDQFSPQYFRPFGNFEYVVATHAVIYMRG